MSIRPRKASRGEYEFALLAVEAGLRPGMQTEYRFCERLWRFDFAWPESRVALEIEGGIWTNGRHTRGSGFEKDLEKYNRAAIDGWTVIRVTTKQAKDGTAIDLVQQAMSGRSG